MTARQMKRVFIGLVIFLACWFLYPTYTWYRMDSQERETMEKEGSSILNKILNLGLDLRGGMHLILEIDTAKMPEGMKLKEAVDRAMEIVRNRVDQFGIAEPLIVKQGEKWIVVQLPGIKDARRAMDLIGKTALLEFKLVNDQGKMSEAIEGNIPDGYELLPGKEERQYLVKKEAELTGASLVDAKVEIGGKYGFPYVSIKFNKEGAKKFALVTEDNIERNLAIVLDGVVQSAPVIKNRIPDGNAIIEGNFTAETARDLAIILRAGALPAPVNVIENRTVGPSLGRDSIKKGILAMGIGAILVVLFMLFYYRLSGSVAVFALFLNLILILGAMAYLHATLTLPGLAGIILTIGMSVDANVLIFERIREELKSGKTVRVAIDAGYQKAFKTILDSNITTLIAAAFLFQFGTGPVKGFAVTLTLGILVSMFTAIMVTHEIFNWALSGKKVEKLSI